MPGTETVVRSGSRSPSSDSARLKWPAAITAGPLGPPPNTLGPHRVIFTVDDIGDTITRLLSEERKEFSGQGPDLFPAQLGSGNAQSGSRVTSP
ncbi:hypothetical protein GCM10017687_11800 [Streptomyces echinatus]